LAIPACAASAPDAGAAAVPGPAVPFLKGRARGAAAARRAKRVARRLAQGSVLAAGLVALQLGAFDSDPRERLFDVHVVDRLETPLTHYRD
jgi:hypothetical protein